MKVALTVWDGRVSPVFDVSREVVLLTIENGGVIDRRDTTLHTPNAFGKVDRLVELGVETLICGAISRPLQEQLIERGVEVVGFVADEIEEIVHALLTGSLRDPALAMPGCRRRRRRHRGGRGHQR